MSFFGDFYVSSYCLDGVYIYRKNIFEKRISFLSYSDSDKLIIKQKRMIYNKKRASKLITNLIRERKEEQRLTETQKQNRRIICRLINEGRAIREMRERNENVLKHFWDLDAFNIYKLILL